MKSLLIIAASVLALALLHGAIGQRRSQTRINNDSRQFAPGDLIWQDEFDFLDRKKWANEININGGHNNEFQIYDKYNENAYCRGGVLYIKPTMSLDTVFKGNFETLYNGLLTLQGCTDTSCTRQARYPNINQPIVSQRMRTKGLFSFRYGRIQVRARMPSGDWTWPAIWMLPELDKYGGWPTSGEIDIVESRGNRKLFDPKGTNIGCEQMASTLHFGPNPQMNGFMKAHGTKNTPVDRGYDRDFHIYETTWTPDMIEFKVDGTAVKTVKPPRGGFFELGGFPNNVNNPWKGGTNTKMAPFDENFHFIFNVATGGDYFPRDSRPPPPWGTSTAFLDFFNKRNDWSPSWSGENAAMAVDYIRVYAV